MLMEAGRLDCRTLQVCRFRAVLVECAVLVACVYRGTNPIQSKKNQFSNQNRVLSSACRSKGCEGLDGCLILHIVLLRCISLLLLQGGGGADEP